MAYVVPDACTLPTAEQPLRLAEFDDLFTAAVRQVEPVSPTHARMWLSGPDGLEATVRDLAARETQCCSFFAFTVTPRGGGVLLDVEVPAQYADVLAALAGRAATVASGGGPVTAPVLDLIEPAARADVPVDVVRRHQHATPPVDNMPPTRSRVSGILAAVACAACCALPLLIAAGVLTTTGAAILEKTLLAVAAGFAVPGRGMWWLHRRRNARRAAAAGAGRGCGGGGCGC